MKPRHLSSSGMITVDFLFAIVLIFGFTTVLFSLAFSLSVAEVTQYITFASARNFSAAHETPTQQRDLAIRKYNELVAHPVFRPLYTNGWFAVDAEPEVGDLSKLFPEYQDAPAHLAQGGTYFWGVGTNFSARMLDFKIPFYGSTSTESDDGRGFSTFLASYLGREISALECREFHSRRWQAIKALDSAYGTTPNQDSSYVSQSDNGC